MLQSKTKNCDQWKSGMFYVDEGGFFVGFGDQHDEIMAKIMNTCETPELEPINLERMKEILDNKIAFQRVNHIGSGLIGFTKPEQLLVVDTGV